MRATTVVIVVAMLLVVLGAIMALRGLGTVTVPNLLSPGQEFLGRLLGGVGDKLFGED